MRHEVSVIAFGRIVFTSIFQKIFKGMHLEGLVISVLSAMVWFVCIYLAIAIQKVEQVTLSGCIVAVTSYAFFEFRAVLGGKVFP